MLFIKRERKFSVKLPLKQRLFCYYHGFYSRAYNNYNFKENHYKNYLSDYQYLYKISMINENYKLLLNDKFIFEKHFQNAGFNIVPSICLIENQKIIPTNENVTSIPQLLEIVRTGDLFLKPVLEGGGDGIMVVSYNDGYYLNCSQIEESALIKTITQKCIKHLVLRKFIQQGFSSLFYPSTLNTIRVHTFVNPSDNKTFIGYAFHRFGNSKSGFLDNCQKSSLFANIDLETGTMSKAYSRHNGQVFSYDAHPDTNLPITGRIIPHWDLIKKTLLGIAAKTSYLPYVGWDVILSDADVYILEGNSNPSLASIQMHYALLGNPQIKEFFKHRKVI
jgi:hypothetical protein